MAKYLIGIDEGTTGCKTCVFDTAGNIIGTAYREYPCYYPHPGWVEQEAEDIIPMLFESCREAIASSGIDPADIASVSFSAQGALCVFLGADNKPVRPFIGWQDVRSTKEREAFFEKYPRDEYYAEVGASQITQSFSRYLWVQQNEPEVWAKVTRICTAMDYTLMRFGVDGFYADASSCARTGVFAVDRYDWSDRALEATGLTREMMPKLAKLGEVVGHVSEEISGLTGLPVGCPLSVGAMDCCCSSFGTGAYEDGGATMVIGTYGAIFINSDKPIRDPYGLLMVKPYVPTQTWTIEGSTSCAASSYRWFRDVFCDLEKAASKVSGVSSYEMINNQIATVAPGANGVTYLSYLQGADGVRDNPHCCGGFAGLRLGTTKAEFARAVMEGICYELKVVLDHQLKAGITLSEIRAAGGATNSPLWCQMLADIFQVPIIVTSAKEAGCLGAALIGGIGVGIYKDAKDASEQACRIVHTYQPNPENFAVYEEAYARYNKLYDALSGGFYNN